MNRKVYWSCTKFAEFIRGFPMPKAATMVEWKKWESDCKKTKPLRFWLAEEALDKVQNILYLPIDLLYEFKYWFRNRFITKTHALVSNLERGKWHELDSRILHSLFDELVNFVEVDLAWLNIAFSEESRKKYNVPFWAYGWFKTNTWRSYQSGLDYLDWASKLCIESDNKTPTPQAIAAKEIKELYLWWKTTRQYRKDPYDVSGWTNIYLNSSIWNEDGQNKEEVEKSLDLLTEIENQYDKEDEEMLIRLIKVRKHLWT